MPEAVTQKLYVVFHGLIPLVEEENGFHAILVDMDGHAMEVGHWLTESTLKDSDRGILTLKGVNSGTAGLDAELNLVVHLDKLDLKQVSSNGSCFARIDLPKPDKLHSFFTADATRRLTGAQQPKSQKYSAVQVFEYSVPGLSFDGVSLSRDGEAIWKNVGYTVMENGTKVSVLHIYNEPSCDASDSHAVEEFLKGSSLFGVDVGLAHSEPLPFPSQWKPSQSDLPSGLLLEELAPYGRRQHSISHILDALRRGTPKAEGAPVLTDVFCGALYVIIGIQFWRHMHHP